MTERIAKVVKRGKHPHAHLRAFPPKAVLGPFFRAGDGEANNLFPQFRGLFPPPLAAGKGREEAIENREPYDPA